MQKFKLERNGVLFDETLKGFICGNSYPDSIQIMGKCDITESDWIVDCSTKRRYFIDGVKPISKNAYILHCQSEYQYNQPKQTNAQYNIGTIQGSAIVGNQQYATINIGNNLDDIQKTINSDSSIDSLDKEEFNKLIERLKIITEDNQPVSKGTLAKFSDLLEKHSDIAINLGQVLMSWLSGK